jgi:hypothetical protein
MTQLESPGGDDFSLKFIKMAHILNDKAGAAVACSDGHSGICTESRNIIRHHPRDDVICFFFFFEKPPIFPTPYDDHIRPNIDQSRASRNAQ